MNRIVDLFCGAGGTSTGFAIACQAKGIPYELTVVNHWNVAIKTHKLNHPEAHHICTPLEDVCPSVAVPGHVHHLHASPECIHHSRAAGGKPRNPQSRATAMWVIHWARVKKPDVITVENVVEFTEWGPLCKNGRPIKHLKGNHFKRWVRCLESLGYVVDWRVLNAADYGDPTSRRRFILQARRDGLPIVWPKREFVSRKEQEKGIGKHLPTWRAAREIVDWSDKGESIFTRKKPLAPKTIQRIIRGLEKFGGPAAEPFLLVLRNNMDSASIDDPLSVVTASGAHHMACQPMLVRYNGTGYAEHPESPVPTLTAKDRFGVCQPFFIKYHAGEGKEPRVYEPSDPLGTIDTSNRFGVVDASIKLMLPHQKFEIDGCDDPEEPHRTIDATNGRCNRVVEAFMVSIDHTGSSASSKAHDVNEPVGTLVTKANKCLVEPFLVPQFGEREGQEPRTHSLFDPAPSVTSHGAGALVCPIMVETPDGTYGLDIRLRMLKPSELAAAMGFPAEYKFEGTRADITKQIGNAVPVGLSRAIKSAILSSGISEALVA